MQIQKTVFISYRRKNMYMARAVYADLRENGYDVFMDILTGESGDFSQTLLQQIDARAHFVLILTPSALERCTHPDDWLRREIEYAMEKHRNIIPLRFENFKFEEVQHYLVSDRLKLLPRYNSVKVDDEYFEAAMDRLRSQQYLDRPIELVLHPASPAVKQAAATAAAQVAAAPEVTPEQQEAERLFESGYRKSRLLGDYSGAIADLTRVIELRPDDAEAYHWRGRAQINSGNNSSGLADLKMALRLKPDDPRVPIIRSMIAGQEGNLGLALTEAEMGVRENPNDSEAYVRRGYLRRKKGDFDGAINDYTEAIRLNSHFVLAYNNRGLARHSKGDEDGAINDYEEAIRLNPQYASAYNNRGRALEKKGDITKAIADYEAALKIDPHHGLARKNLNRLKKRKG